MPHTRFLFLHRGARFSAEAFADELDICWAEGCRDAVDNHYTFFRTATRLHARNVMEAIQQHNKRQSRATRIALASLNEGDPLIVTVPRGSLVRCGIYKQIIGARMQAGGSTYWSWAQPIGAVNEGLCVVEKEALVDQVESLDEGFEELHAFIGFF